MGILSVLFGGKRDSKVKDCDSSLDLAFILLEKHELPQAEMVLNFFKEFSRPEETLGIDHYSNSEKDQKVASFSLNTGECFMVAFIPAAVPNEEAEEAAEFSLSRFKGDWKPPKHSAHLIVTGQAVDHSNMVIRLSRFTSFIAAVAKASEAIAIYWGNTGATHSTDFYLSVAADEDILQRITLWSGVSMARESDGRLSLLSLGMQQFQLPDLYLFIGPETEHGIKATEIMETLYDFLSYLVKRGEAFPDGDTVGRTDEEQLEVRYVRSPIDRRKKVWRLELP